MSNHFTTAMSLLRGLAVGALAASAVTLPNVGAAAAGPTLDRYEAIYGSAPSASLFSRCDERVDSGTGDPGCGSITGGPSGGNASRN